MKRKPNTPLVGALVATEIVSAIFAWRDVSARADNRIRGTKPLWRLFILANPGNSLVYWALGRR